TGNLGGLILSPRFVEQHRVLDAVPNTVKDVARGVGGPNKNPMGRIERLELGGLVVDRPVTMFRGAGPGHIGADDAIGNIGGGILRRYRGIFDYPRSRMILEPGAHVADPFEYDMSGLSFRTPPPEYARVMVTRVL